MDEFVRGMHTKSGLLAAIEASTVSLEPRPATPRSSSSDPTCPSPAPCRWPAFPSAPTGDFWPLICPPSRSISTTAPWTCPPSRSWPGAGIPRPWPVLPTRQAAIGPWTTSARAWPSSPTTAPPSSVPPKVGSGPQPVTTARYRSHRRDAIDHHREEPPCPTQPTRSGAGRAGPDTHAGRGHRPLTAPGQIFEIEELDHTGHPHPDVEDRPGHLASRPRALPLHGDKDFLVYEDERITFAEHFRTVATLAHALGDRIRRHQGRPGGHRHAQPARVGHGLLGLHRGGCRRRAPQRLVDRRRTGLRPERLGDDGGLRRRGAPGPYPPPSRRDPRAPGHGGVLRGAPGRTAAGGRPRARPWTGRVGTPAGGPVRRPHRGRQRGRHPSRGIHRSRRRRHHLLHLGHHRAAQGSGGHPPEQRVQPDEPLLRLHRGLHEARPGRWPT